MESYTIDTIEKFIGKELGVSDWMTVDQKRINQFADCTDDHQWIHVDVEKAKKESPLGSTIAHGYLILSLVPRFLYEIGAWPAGVLQAFNYGANRVRFIAPVKTGSRIRNRVKLISAENKGNGRTLLALENTIEIEGENKPALIAEILGMLIAG